MTEKNKPVKKPDPIGGLTPDEKWNEMQRHLLENIKWYRKQQDNPKADAFYFFLRENCEKDILAYMMYLDGKNNPETRLLITLLGNPAAYIVPPHPGNPP